MTKFLPAGRQVKLIIWPLKIDLKFKIENLEFFKIWLTIPKKFGEESSR